MGDILDRVALAARISQDRARGLTIAFANGGFDLLHVGHIRYLEGARREADKLVVAVNSDASVRGLKGPTRPILPEADLHSRMERRAGAADGMLVVARNPHHDRRVGFLRQQCGDGHPDRP